MVAPELGTTMVAQAVKRFALFDVVGAVSAEESDSNHIEHGEKVNDIGNQWPPRTGQQSHHHHPKHSDP